MVLVLNLISRKSNLYRQFLYVEQEWTSLNNWSWRFFSSNYFFRAGARAFRLQYLLPELELEILGSEFFHKAGAGA